MQKMHVFFLEGKHQVTIVNPTTTTHHSPLTTHD